MMNKILLGAAASLAMAVPAMAQNVPAATIGVVDLDRVLTECTACRSAQATLQGQQTALQTRVQQLDAGLKPEAEALQKAVQALGNKAPDAALQTRARAFEQRRAQAAQQLQTQQASLERNIAYVRQQLLTRIEQLYPQTMQRRGVSLLVEKGSTLAMSPALDITNDLLTALNSALPSVSTTAPAAAAQPAPATTTR